MKRLALFAVVFVMFLGIQAEAVYASGSIVISRSAAFHESIERIKPQLPDHDPDNPSPLVIAQQQAEDIQSLLDYVESDKQIRKDMGQKNYKGFIDAMNEILTILQTTQEPASATSQSTYSMVEIPFDTVINSNTIWNEDVHLNGRVYVDSAMLVITPGVTVYNDPNSGIVVKNNGVLIADGLPDNPITFTANSPTEYDAITIEETALTACKINHCMISNASKGIYIQNIELDNPIENNTFNRCYDGIVQYGPRLTDIYNNLLTDNTEDGIEISLVGPLYPADPNGASAATKIKIEHNLINDASYGITIWGSDNAIDAGTVIMKNNCITSCSQYAVYLSDWMATIRLSNAYYANNQIGDAGSDVLPVYLTNDPFVNGVDVGPYYLLQDTDMVDAAITYDELTYELSYESIANTNLVGKTTSETGSYDSGIADIGYHYQGWDITTLDPDLAADISQDDFVNNVDFALFSQNWQQTYNPQTADPNGLLVRSDFDSDGSIDIDDLTTMASMWLYSKGEPYGVALSFDQDQSNIVGDFAITVDVAESNVIETFLLFDEEIVGKTSELNSYLKVVLESWRYSNGQHSFKAFCVLSNGEIVYSDTKNVLFNNTLHYVIADEYFHPDDGYKLSGLYGGGNTVQAVIADMYGAAIWSNDYTGSAINIDVSGTVFSTHQFCELSIDETSGARSATSSSDSIKKDLVKKFKKSDYTGERMIIIMPTKDVFKVRKPAIIECAKACDNRSVGWIPLYYHNVTEDNLRFLYNDSRVKYIYWSGHANSHVGKDEGESIPGVQRTHTICWKRTEKSWRPDKWEEIGLFSWTNASPPLPNDWDNRGVSLWLFGMHSSNRKRIVFVDGCLSAVYSDNAQAYGMASWNDGQIYIGWRIKFLVSTGIIEQIVGNTTEGVRMFWERMGSGDNIFEAFYYTQTHGGVGVRRSMWGDNAILEIGSPDTDDNIFLWGDQHGLNEELDP